MKWNELHYVKLAPAEEFYEDKANIGFFLPKSKMDKIDDDFNSKIISFNEENDFDEDPF